jgi:O-antigen/teichoic acid export membrane protein
LRTLNLVSSNIALATTALVGVVLTRLIITNLGPEVYGEYALLLSLVSIMTTIGNTTSGAMSRFVTMSNTVSQHKSSMYLSAGIAIVLLTAGVFVFPVYPLMLVSGIAPSFPYRFAVTILLALCIGQVASLFSIGNFVSETIYVRSAVNAIGRLAFLAVAWVGFTFAPAFGYWALSVGLAVESLFRAVVFRKQLTNRLPDVHLRVFGFQWRVLGEIAEYSGWVTLIYVGTFITKAGILASVRSIRPDSLAMVAVAVQVTTLVLQVLTTGSSVTAPSMYRNIAKEDFQAANLRFKEFILISFIVGWSVFFVVLGRGEFLFDLWIGEPSAIPKIQDVLVGIASMVVVSINIPTSVFLSATNRMRSYGVASIIEAGAVVSLTALIATSSEFDLSKMFVAMAVLSLGKNLWASVVDKRIRWYNLNKHELAQFAEILTPLIVLPPILLFLLNHFAVDSLISTLISAVFAAICGYFAVRAALTAFEKGSL